MPDLIPAELARSSWQSGHSERPSDPTREAPHFLVEAIEPNEVSQLEVSAVFINFGEVSCFGNCSKTTGALFVCWLVLLERDSIFILVKKFHATISKTIARSPTMSEVGKSSKLQGDGGEISQLDIKG